MNSQTVQLSNFKLPTTHSFIYKDKKYPFNFDFFKLISKKLSKMQNEFSNTKEIGLLPKEDEPRLNISDETIQNFINFCQMMTCEIKNDNVLHLNYLSKLYEVEELKNATDNYISNHRDELRIEILSFGEICPTNTETIEESIAKDLINYIKEERMISLSIPVLHRIFSIYFKSNEHLNEDENSKIFDFLFKYLERNGRKASVLFSFLDFSKISEEHQRILLNKTSSEFDFHFINSKFMKLTYEKSNDLLRNFQIFDDFKEEMNAKFKSFVHDQQRKEEELKNEINNMKNEMLKLNAVTEKVYPVGSIYMSVNDTNPKNLFGGKWIEWGQGRVPVGVSKNGTFNYVEKIGGEETHKLNLNEIPSHQGHVPNKEYDWGSCDETTYYIDIDKACSYGNSRPFVKRAGNELVLRSFPEGGNNPHNNLQPYITCYMWKRTE